MSRKLLYNPVWLNNREQLSAGQPGSRLSFNFGTTSEGLAYNPALPKQICTLGTLRIAKHIPFTFSRTVLLMRAA